MESALSGVSNCNFHEADRAVSGDNPHELMR